MILLSLCSVLAFLFIYRTPIMNCNLVIHHSHVIDKLKKLLNIFKMNKTLFDYLQLWSLPCSPSEWLRLTHENTSIDDRHLDLAWIRSNSLSLLLVNLTSTTVLVVSSKLILATWHIHLPIKWIYIVNGLGATSHIICYWLNVILCMCVCVYMCMDLW